MVGCRSFFGACVSMAGWLLFLVMNGFGLVATSIQAITAAMGHLSSGMSATVSPEASPGQPCQREVVSTCMPCSCLQGHLNLSADGPHVTDPAGHQHLNTESLNKAIGFKPDVMTWSAEGLHVFMFVLAWLHRRPHRA